MAQRTPDTSALDPVDEAYVHWTPYRGGCTPRCRKNLGAAVIASPRELVTCPWCLAGKKWKEPLE
jgi:hypothetical protein